MLTLSAAFSAYGYVFGIIAFSYACFNLFICLSCFKSLMMSYPNALIYSTLVKYVLGNRSSLILNYIYLVYVGGSLIGYILVTNNLLVGIFLDMIANALNITSDTTKHYMKLISILILGTLSLPLTIRTTIPKIFTKMTLVTMGVIIYLIGLMFVQMFFYATEYKVKSGPKYIPFKYNVIDYFRYYGNYVYSFNVVGKFSI